MVNITEHGGLFAGGSRVRGQQKTLVKYAEDINIYDPVQVKYVNTKLADPVSLPTSVAIDVAYSPDGNYLAVSHESSSPYLEVYKRDGEIYTKLVISGGPTHGGHALAWSHDSTHLLYGTSYGVQSEVCIYRHNGDSIAQIGKLPGLYNDINSLDYSSDGQYVAAAHNGVPYISFYKRSSDTYTKLASPDILPSGQGYSVKFSPNDEYVSLSHDTSPFLALYKRNGDSFTKVTNPSVLPAYTGESVAWSPDGTRFLYGLGSIIKVYKVIDGVFSFIKDVNTSLVNGGSLRSMEFSYDGKFLTMISSNVPHIVIFKRNGDEYTLLEPPILRPVSTGVGVSYSPDGNYLAVSASQSPYLYIYRNEVLAYKTRKPSDYGVISLGYALQTGATGETKKIMNLFE